MSAYANDGTNAAGAPQPPQPPPQQSPSLVSPAISVPSPSTTTGAKSTSGTKTPRSAIMNKNSGAHSKEESGQKTPRKVQWRDERERDEQRELHGLDEHGLDPTAIDYFTTALVRHQSQAQSQSQSQPASLQAPSLSPSHSLGVASVRSESSAISPDPTTSRNTAANAASATTGKGPRIHYFPPRQNPPSIHTDIPYQRESSVPVGADHNRHLSTATSATSDDPIIHEEGGPTDKQYQVAQNIVRAHTRNRGRGRGLFLNLGRKGKSRSRERDGEEGRGRRGGRSDAEAPPAALPGGGGVLSALLTLYNQENGLPSGVNTPVTEEPPAVPSAWVDYARRTPGTATPGSTESQSKPSSPTKEQEFLLKRSNSMSSGLNKLGVKVGGARPKNERNSAGVFASLIASTGNISGPAAPAPSTLQPDVKRPGYHLSRYSLESKVPTIKHPSPTVERPRSMVDQLEMRDLTTARSNDTLSTLIDNNGHHEKGHQKAMSTSTTGSREKSPHTPSHKSKWSGVLKDFPYASSVMSLGRITPSQTPIHTPSVEGEDPFNTTPVYDRKERERRKRRKAEIFITRHVAEIIQRQEFILKLARAMMMFGAPSHRLQAQIQATGRVLDVEVSCMYLPDVMLISFDDASTATSSIRFIRQGSALDLGKLGDAYELYWKVIHDDLAVADASAQLTTLMKKRVIYRWWVIVPIGGMCSSAICTVSFNGSFIDALVVFPLGALLVAMQIGSMRNELYSNVFEIVAAGVFSFLAGCLASTNKLCYSAVASSSVVLILPGFIVLIGSLEIMSRNIVSGSVRMFYAVIYSLFLGFGLAMGAEAYQKIFNKDIVGIEDYTCSVSHDPEGGWWQRDVGGLWAFLTVPLYSTFLSLRNYIPYKRKEMPLLVIISSIGWVTNHFVSLKFSGQADISAAVGAFAVGFVANVYGRFFDGNAFVIMITGILFQLPSGLGNGGLLAFVSDQTEGSSSSYLSGFQTALQLISVAIGLTVGLGLSLLVVHPIPSRKRGGGVFSL